MNLYVQSGNLSPCKIILTSFSGSPALQGDVSTAESIKKINKKSALTLLLLVPSVRLKSPIHIMRGKFDDLPSLFLTFL